ncbi:MAG: PKD domain-containing protein [Chitinophagales bacterium]|nr:PKD domain-containing protein [Chitinophagales bacterium]
MITVPPLPTAAFNISTPTCINQPVQFTDASFSNIVGWNWTFSNGATSLNQNPQVTFTTSGTHSAMLIVTDMYGCTNNAMQTFNVNSPSPIGQITAVPDTIVCSGTLVTLTAPACTGCTYLWSTGATTQSTTVSSTGVYNVTVTDNACAQVLSVSIIVNALPPVIINNSGKDELCLGDFTQLSVPNNSNYTYQWISNDPSANGTTNNFVVVNPITTGNFTYQVIVTDTSTGCSDTSLVYTIVVHPLPAPPVITALTPTTVCQGDTIVLVGSHPDPTVTLTWSTGSIHDTIYVINTGCYTLFANDTNGCKSNTTLCVTVNPLPYLCSFYEGCLDTCSPYIIKGPVGAASYLWLLNGVSTGVTTPTYTATVSGAYSVIVTNGFGCIDTTGVLNLNVYPCDTHQCADLVIDSVKCLPNGTFVMYYHVTNLTQDTITEVSLQVLPPHQNIAIAPVLNLIALPPNATTPTLTATLYNANAGDTVCFRAHIIAYDSLGEPVVCCPSDTECVTLPPCLTDTSCCAFHYVKDTVWCQPGPTGNIFHFSITINGCGNMTVSTGLLPGVLNGVLGNYVLNNQTITLNGSYVPSGPADTLLCFTYVVVNSLNVPCKDTTICLRLRCPQSNSPVCIIDFNDTICVGQTTTYQYGGNPSGLTFFWQFNFGTPNSATGPGPHTITYNIPGCHKVVLIINNNLPGTLECLDTVCVLPPPVAAIQQSGNVLMATPAGYAYQWYAGYPGNNPIPGAVNQFYQPNTDGFYCVVVGAGLCSDTACIDFNVSVLDLEKDNIQLIPNPNRGTFTLRIAQHQNESMQLYFRNALGQILYSTQLELRSGVSEFLIQQPWLASGMYLVQLSGADSSVVLRMMVE